MPKEGIKIEEIKPIFPDVNKRNGWSLCIGSGTSLPIFPDWYTLINKIINEKCDENDKISVESLMKHGNSADAMMQCIRNILKVEERDFAKIISEILYADLKKKLTVEEWNSVSMVLDSSNCNQLKDKIWMDFIKVRDTEFANTSANSIAKVVLKTIDIGIEPKSILTFNAESLLLAIINSYIREPYIGKIKIKDQNFESKFDKIVSGISNVKQNRIPYIFCHGTLPTFNNKFKKFEFGIHKLVFSESTYLNLANNAFSWQSNSFINACSNHRVIFIGLSLTDANIRKWLSWIHFNRMNEYKQYDLKVNESTNHYWIRVLPENENEKKWIEASVAHLGIRLIWINNWEEVEEAMNRLFNIV